MKTRPDSTLCFSNRVPDYQRARPSYPTGLITLLRDEIGLGPGRTVADVGSGTGILTGLLLDTGNRRRAQRRDAGGGRRPPGAALRISKRCWHRRGHRTPNRLRWRRDGRTSVSLVRRGKNFAGISENPEESGRSGAHLEPPALRWKHVPAGLRALSRGSGEGVIRIFVHRGKPKRR